MTISYATWFKRVSIVFGVALLVATVIAIVAVPAALRARKRNAATMLAPGAYIQIERSSGSTLSDDGWWTPKSRTEARKRIFDTPAQLVVYHDYDWNGVADWKLVERGELSSCGEFIRIGQNWTKVWRMKTDPRAGRKIDVQRWYVFVGSDWVPAYRDKDNRIQPADPGDHEGR